MSSLSSSSHGFKHPNTPQHVLMCVLSSSSHGFKHPNTPQHVLMCVLNTVCSTTCSVCPHCLTSARPTVSGTDEGNQADPMITGVVNGPGLDKGSVYSSMGVAEANVAGTGACFALVLPPWSHTINKDLPLPTIVIWNDSEKRFDNGNATVAQYVVCVQELIRDIIGTGKQEEDWELPVENSIQSNSRVLTDSALFSVFVALYLDSFDEDNVDPTLLTKETSGLNSYCRTRHSITTAELQAVRLLLIAKAKRLKGFATDLEKSGTITKANWMGGFADKLLISLISGRKLVCFSDLASNADLFAPLSSNFTIFNAAAEGKYVLSSADLQFDVKNRELHFDRNEAVVRNSCARLAAPPAAESNLQEFNKHFNPNSDVFMLHTSGGSHYVGLPAKQSELQCKKAVEGVAVRIEVSTPWIATLNAPG
jgi:hypothetical protein